MNPIQSIQILGWIIVVIIPVIFFLAINPEKTAQYKKIKRIICFVLIGVLALGIIARLLGLLNYLLFSIEIPRIVWRIFYLWGFIPSVTAIIFPLLRGFHVNISMIPWFVFSILDILFYAGMIFFFFTKANQLNEEDDSLTEGENNSLSDETTNLTTKKRRVKKLTTNRGFWLALLLSIITFGFYGFYLIHAFAKDTNIACKEDNKRTSGFIVFFLLSLVTFGIYGIVWFCMWISRCNEYLRKNNKPDGLLVSTFLLTLFLLGPLTLGIMYLVVFCKMLYLQNAVNRTHNEINNL